MRKLFFCAALVLFLLSWVGLASADFITKAFTPSQLAGSNPGPAGTLAGHGERPAILQVFDVVDSVPAPGASHMGLAWDGTYLWSVSNELTPIVIYKIDPITKITVDTLTTSVNDYVLGLTFLNGYLWLQEWWSLGTTFQIDPTTGGTVNSITSPGGTGSRGLGNDGTNLWIASTGGGVNNGTIYLVDTLGATQRTVDISSVINWPMGMTYSQSTGYMWLNDDDVMNDVNELDVSGPTATLISEHTPPGSPGSEIPEGLTNDGNFLWYTAFYANWIWKINITPFDHDVKSDVIYSPSDIVIPGMPVTIEARFRNSGQNTEDFTVWAEVDSQGTQIHQDSQSIVGLANGDTVFVSFPVPWDAPVEGNTYVVRVYTDLVGDMLPANDTIEVVVQATFGEKLCIDDGVMVNAHAWWDDGNIWAVQYTPSEYPAYLDSVQVYILSAGDPYYPWPDGSHQPFIIEVFDDGGGQPGSVVFEDTVLADDTPPSWVKAYPDVKIESGDFWPTHHQVGDNPACEGMGVDASVNNSVRNWGRIAGVWQTYGGSLSGDLMICAYVRYRGLYDVGTNSIDSPGRIVESGVPVDPMATVLNDGRLTAQSFQVACRIDSAGTQVYFDQVAVDSLQSDSTTQVTFASWTPGPPLNDYGITVYTIYASDPRISNDTLHALTSSFQLAPMLYSPAAGIVPDFDGLIDFAEWSDANIYDISDVFQKQGEINFPLSALLYVKNDVNQVYFAIDAVFDDTRNEFDKVGFAFDDDRDDAYPAPGDDSEGLVTLYYTNLLDFVSYTAIHSDGSQSSSYGVNFGAGTAFPLGHQQYELAVPFGSLDEELDAGPLDTVGMFVLAADTSISGSEYGGWWFQNVEESQWDEPAYYGDLVFSDGIGVSESRPFRPIITEYRLAQNFPNPFSSFTVVEYCIPEFADGTRTSVRVYDSAGRTVSTLIEKEHLTGKYRLIWDGTDASGASVAGGTYFARLESGDFAATRRLVLVR
jgi:hypothetical protein